MKIKLNKTQLESIELIMRVLLADNKPQNTAELLVYNIVYKIYTKIRNKTETLGTPKSGYNITLTEQETMAFHIFYQNVYIDNKAYQYEAILLQNIFNQTDTKNDIRIR